MRELEILQVLLSLTIVPLEIPRPGDSSSRSTLPQQRTEVENFPSVFLAEEKWCFPLTSAAVYSENEVVVYYNNLLKLIIKNNGVLYIYIYLKIQRI